MKKILLGSLLFTALFTACSSDDDYNAGIASPQASDPTATQSFGNGTVTEVGVINLADVTTETVQVATIVAPVPTSETAKLDSMVISFTDEEGGDAVTTAIGEDGLVPTDFFTTSIVEAFYGKRPVERTINASLVAYFRDGNEAFLINSGEFKVKAIPAAPHISENYYIVGGPNDWNDAALKQIKFSHSDKDVYEDPVFTVVFDAAASGDTWFAIGDDEACEAIPNDWSKLLGIVGGDSQSTEGRLDVRSNMGADNSFCVPAGAKKIKVTINMMEYSFMVEPVSVADAYYLVGGPLDWAGSAASKEQKFSHSSASVVDDPVFTYVLAGTGSETWFAIGDDEACDAITNDGDWSKLYGTTAGNGNSGFSGSLDRRSALADDGSFKVDGTAKFYRIQINMAELTYTITELNFEPIIYFIGATDGWANAEQKLALTDESGIYTGFLFCADPNGWGNEFKFQREAGNWDTEINTGHMTGGINGDFGDGGGNFKATAGEGVYYVTLDMANLTLNAVKVEKMGIIGDFNGWGGDVDMTWNAADYCYEATGAGVTAAGWKFRINADWAINLGGASLDNLVANGDNLSAVGNTIKLYPTRRTSDNIFCTVE